MICQCNQKPTTDLQHMNYDRQSFSDCMKQEVPTLGRLILKTWKWSFHYFFKLWDLEMGSVRFWSDYVLQLAALYPTPFWQWNWAKVIQTGENNKKFLIMKGLDDVGLQSLRKCQHSPFCPGRPKSNSRITTSFTVTAYTDLHDLSCQS